jgi:PKD domain
MIVFGSRVRLNVEKLERRDVPATPLPDLGSGLYQGFMGGLYPGGQNSRPEEFQSAGIAIAQNQVRPLNSAGQPDSVNGRIVMISIGMSNTTQEFGTSSTGAFKIRADADPAKNPRLTIVDGAIGGQAANAWVDPASPNWTTVMQRLTSAGVTAQQVEVIWMKQADAQPNQYGAFPAHAQHLQGELEAITRNIKTKFPNARIEYVSSRTMSYSNVVTGLNPEPFAYESGFSTKWMIQNQIQGTGNLNYDPNRGAVVAPWLSWGPYLWNNGATPRSDGFTWLQSDLQSDLTHPSASGVRKVADQLLAFFKTDPTATPWFLRSAPVGQPPTITDTFVSATTGSAPLTVQFKAVAGDSDGTISEYVWTYDDGTFSYAQSPTKTFAVPGNYHVHLIVVDNSGNVAQKTFLIRVFDPAWVGPSAGKDATKIDFFPGFSPMHVSNAPEFVSMADDAMPERAIRCRPILPTAGSFFGQRFDAFF